MESIQQDSQPQNETVDNGLNVTNQQQMEGSTPDLSAYFRDGEPGVFDAEKVAGLARDLENQKKSTSYFQSQFMKKNGVPENYEDYYKTFKADSMYESAMDDETVKESVENLYKWCHENKIGQRESNLMADYILKNAVQSGILDMRTDEERDAEFNKKIAEETEKLKPMLESLNRTKEENDIMLQNFFNYPNAFNRDPEVSDYLFELAEKDSRMYKHLTNLMQATEHRGVPYVTGTAATKDKAAVTRDYNQETDPEKREALMRAYLGED